MSVKYNISFKISAVEKALNRPSAISVKEVAKTLDVGLSTLQKWIQQSKNQEFETISLDKKETMTKEKRPQEWTPEERMEIVIQCASLEAESIGKICREKGIFDHHLKQWKSDFIKGKSNRVSSKDNNDIRILKNENKSLKKELLRKDKALAETAALLVLKKKVDDIWGDDEDN